MPCVLFTRAVGDDVTLLSLTSTSDSVAHKAVVTDLSSNAKAPAPTVHINDSSSEDVDSTSKDSCAPAHHCNTESRMMPGPTNAVQQAAALLNAGAQHHVRNVIFDLEKAANHLLPDISHRLGSSRSRSLRRTRNAE